MKLRRKKREEEKPAERFTVVREDDCRIPKYLFSEAADGFGREHAERLAYHVRGQTARYVVVPLEVHRYARQQGQPLTPQAAQAAYDAQKPEEDE